MKAIIRSAYHAVRAMAGKPRANRIISHYAEHHQEAMALWCREGNVGRSVSLSGVIQTQTPGTAGEIPLPADWTSRVSRLATAAATALDSTERCLFLPRMSRDDLPKRCSELLELAQGRLLAINLSDPWDLDGLAGVADPLVKHASAHYFSAYAIVDKIYVYRNPIANAVDQVSWRWHYDNHPDQILKFMVYLTDVQESTGPFAYLGSDQGPATCVPQPLAADTWFSPKRLAKFESKGYRPRYVTGPMGTVLTFDNNIVHKANQAKSGHRDVIVFQVRPATFKPTTSIDRRWTGSFLHEDFNQDPYQHVAIPKRKVLSG